MDQSGKNARGRPAARSGGTSAQATNSKSSLTSYFKQSNTVSAQKATTEKDSKKPNEDVQEEQMQLTKGSANVEAQQISSKSNDLHVDVEKPSSNKQVRSQQTSKDSPKKKTQLAHEDGDEDMRDDEEGKRQLRPRKIENYRAMLEDEITLKTIKDEEKEKKRLLNPAANEDEDEEMYGEDLEIERASDDEDEDDSEFGVKGGKNTRSATKKKFAEDCEDSEPEVQSSDEAEDNDASVMKSSGVRRKDKAKSKKSQVAIKKRSKAKKNGEDGEEDDADDDDGAAAEDETVFIDNLPNDEFDIRRMLKEVKRHIKILEKQFFEEEDSEKEEELKQINNVPQHEEALQAFKEATHLKQFWCIPLSVNVTSFDFDHLAEQQVKNGGRLFDIITIDPPWQLSSANPTRGVAIAYDTLNDREILNIPFHKIQTDGFLFIWVINAKYRFALQMMEEFGYKLVDEIAWVKQTVNGKIAKGHGYYLQHAKETCLVGMKGNVQDKARFNIESDVIFSQRRGQSQKPEEIYEIAESLVPNGYYLEIFGRRNNLHNGWVTIGNEL